MQPAGDLVAAAVAELAAGVQHGQHDLHRRATLLLVHRDGDAAAVVNDRHGVVGMDRDGDLGAAARQRLIHRVVHNLVHKVVQAHHAGRADVHAGALAHRLQALEHGDVLRVIAGLDTCRGVGYSLLRAARARGRVRALLTCGQ